MEVLRLLGDASWLHELCPLGVVDECRRVLLAGNRGVQTCLSLLQQLQQRDMQEGEKDDLASAFRRASIRVRGPGWARVMLCQ
jgi:hypothetical protein